METSYSNKTSLPNENVLQLMQEELESRQTGQIALEAFFCSLILSSSVLGNSLTLYVVLKNPALRTIPNMFVISLALSDLFVGLTAVLIAETVLIKSEWPFDDMTCQFQAFMIISNSATALLTITLTSINRFFKIVRNNSYRRYFTEKRALMMILGAWVIGLLLPVPFLLSGNTYIFIPAKFICFLDVTSEWRIYVSAVTSVVLGLPLIVVAYCYLRIFLTVTMHQSNTFQSSQSTTSNVQEIKITRMMFVIVLFFNLCWAPALIVNTIDSAKGSFTLPRGVYVTITFLGSLSCAINPVIYGVMNPTFRKAFIKALRCGKSHGNNIVQPQ